MLKTKIKQSIGVDIVDVGRVAGILDRFGERFINRLLCDEEQFILKGRKDRADFLAGRFAAKEATIKALGTYISDRPAFPLMKVLATKSGQPELVFGGHLSESLRRVSTLISISHEKTHAVAVVLLTGES